MEDAGSKGPDHLHQRLRQGYAPGRYANVGRLGKPVNMKKLTLALRQLIDAPSPAG